MLFLQYSNIALLKMNHEMGADIRTDSWPDFNSTVIKLPISQVCMYHIAIPINRSKSEGYAPNSGFEAGVLGCTSSS